MQRPMLIQAASNGPRQNWPPKSKDAAWSCMKAALKPFQRFFGQYYDLFGRFFKCAAP